MAGGGSSGQPPPEWLIRYTLAVYTGYLVATGGALFSALSFSGGCDGIASCTGRIGDIFTGLLNFVTIGGLSGFMPVWMQGIHLLIMGMGWGPVIWQAILNVIGALNL